MSRVLFETNVGGVCAVRRLVGIAHNADFERIEDQGIKAVCESRALRFGMSLLVHHASFPSIEAVIESAITTRTDGKAPCYEIAA